MKGVGGRPTADNVFHAGVEPATFKLEFDVLPDELMILRPTPTWRHSRRQYITLLLLLSFGMAGCVEREAAPAKTPPIPVGLTSPVTMPGPPPAPQATGCSIAPVYQLADLFKSKEVAVPPVFEGLKPGMPLLAAQVLLPDRLDDTTVRAKIDNLSFHIIPLNSEVRALTIRVEKPAEEPSLNTLKQRMTQQWGTASNGYWFSPGLRAKIEGQQVVFEAWQTVDVFLSIEMARLRSLLGRPSPEVQLEFTGAQPKADGFEMYLNPLQWTGPIRVNLQTEKQRISAIELTVEHSSDTAALTAALGTPTPLKNLRRFTVR